MTKKGALLCAGLLSGMAAVALVSAAFGRGRLALGLVVADLVLCMLLTVMPTWVKRMLSARGRELGGLASANDWHPWQWPDHPVAVGVRPAAAIELEAADPPAGRGTEMQAEVAATPAGPCADTLSETPNQQRSPQTRTPTRMA